MSAVATQPTTSQSTHPPSITNLHANHTMALDRIFASPLCLLAWAACGLPPAMAHHGQEFLVVQDSSVPSMWSGTVFGGLEWSRAGNDDEISVEPGFLLGVGPRFAVGSTMGFSGAPDDWGYESIAPFVQVDLTPPRWPVRVAVIAGHHFADGSRDETIEIDAPTVSTVATSSARPIPEVRVAPAPTPPPPPDPDPPCGPEFGPDAPPCPEPTNPAPTPRRKLRHAGHVPGPVDAAPAPAPPTTSNSSSTTPAASPRPSKGSNPTPPYDGIHRHGEDHTFGRLVVEADLTPADKLIFNLIAIWPDDGKPAWGYAAGFRHSFSHALAAGVEAIGDFGDANEHELILGGYFSPNHQITFKWGAGLGLTDPSPDFSLRTGAVWRF